MPKARRFILLLTLGVLAHIPACIAAPVEPGDPLLLVPKTALTAREVAVVINDRDPLSVEIGAYYQQRRAIPAENVIHVSLPPDRDEISTATFEAIQARLSQSTPSNVQAYALTWIKPYRVACMSITSAFALGFSKAYCATGCRTTMRSPYFDSNSSTPYTDYRMRPAMSIAAKRLADAKALIDRGVASDDSLPAGTGYLVETTDTHRNVRARNYDTIVKVLGGEVGLRHIKAQYIKGKDDILFYFIGAKDVPDIDSNKYVPGAIADHLTSAGGMLSGSGQMISLRWLQAGATGSYGAVVEPCNFPGKFPNPGVVIQRYVQGETLLEAYWKSVAMPGQGIFIGEPLARPFGGYAWSEADGRFSLRTHSLRPGQYLVMGADAEVGPYSLVAKGITVGMGEQRIAFPDAHKAVYALAREDAVAPGGLRLGTVEVHLNDAADPHEANPEPAALSRTPNG